MKIILFIIGCFGYALAWAGGPTQLAYYDRKLWPYPIDSPAAFDNASRHEIEVFADVIDKTPLNTAEQITRLTKVKQPDVQEVQAWVSRTRNILLANYQAALKTCQPATQCLSPSSWTDLVNLSHHDLQSLNAKDQTWKSAAERFYMLYLYEQIRLAALFNKYASEIEKMDPREKLGHELPDKHFLLTYDDGPSDKYGPQLTNELRRFGISAQFFLLGTALEKNTHDLTSIYQGQCIGSHSYVHKPHRKTFPWQESLDKNRELLIQQKFIQSSQKINVRPPYGERNIDMVKYILGQGDAIMLWNIDSQDWMAQMQTYQTLNRVMTLMLVWRRGIILFHEIHPKALELLPQLNDFAHQSQIEWINCKTMAPRTP